ncbi:hypothetical protein BU24DRAFT_417030 [Aaosphaeria arxii CBS 175.79]|uniref:Zn(2)-C6 fungal-type domain-containing protein n=1 Tax=Aaosphaeria arxii CBS 175.79 TaxID=1450172 RepID=A0A6A5Y759_9PLEO|nr:uncharacterized protein BU24DRAFT_417030 [Aaosphaeria arxii CBS 175.79]KAF2021368.1 hypothetical protein BU24DRAFT_417030 [Aaosphaeria arxii CBS 175.79]
MGFSGKPSKGCAPCRAKRTKCDLAVPSCTQCIRKGRVCSGYRNEQDLLFRNETKLVVRKAKRRHESQSPPPNHLPMEAFSMQLFNPMPSRRAAVNDEAEMHFFAHLNEKLFASQDCSTGGGYDYILPVYSQDLLSNGPVPEIIRATGLAALGSTRGSPELLIAARQKRGQVLRHLNQQLQDPRMALSDSSILTCVLLSLFENVLCEGSQSTQAMTYHLQGALTLSELRGSAQFSTEVGRGIYARMRGFILAHCLQTRDPIPPFILTFLDDESITQRDFAPDFYKLLARLCQLRSDHKQKGYVDAPMATEASSLVNEFDLWHPHIPDWHPYSRPSADDFRRNVDDDTYRFMWLSNTWFFKHTARVLASDMVIEYARAQLLLAPASASATSTLADAVSTQTSLCVELRDSTEYYFDKFRSAESCQRTAGGYGLLWPLYVLSMSATSTSETMLWIKDMASGIADAFGIRQGRAMADFIALFCSPPADDGFLVGL